jgi:hypothetical protein
MEINLRGKIKIKDVRIFLRIIRILQVKWHRKITSIQMKVKLLKIHFCRRATLTIKREVSKSPTGAQIKLKER